MLLHHVGELKLLRDLRTKFGVSRRRHDDGIVLGIGDDAAVISIHGKAVVTTDLMHEGVHFDLSFTSAFQVGFKLVSVNVSDVMAMGGKPCYVFLDFAARSDTSEAFFWDFFDGVRAALDRYGLSLLGGDLSAAPHDMVCAATVIGTADHVVTRAGASVGFKTVPEMNLWSQLVAASPDVIIGLLTDCGTMSFGELAQLAVKVARQGFPAHAILVRNLDFSLGLLPGRENWVHDPDAGELQGLHPRRMGAARPPA